MRDISLHLMDILQNSISAHAARITASIHADETENMLVVRVEDDGRGMDAELLNLVTDPFTTTRMTRKVGLGIPLLKESAARAGGKLGITSVLDQGTVLEASFVISHIDRPPLGSVEETIASLIMAEPDIEYRLELSSGNGKFTLDTLEVRQKLGDVPINNFEVITWIRDYIKEGITDIFGGVLDEIDR